MCVLGYGFGVGGVGVGGKVTKMFLQGANIT